MHCEKSLGRLPKDTRILSVIYDVSVLHGSTPISGSFLIWGGHPFLVLDVNVKEATVCVFVNCEL